MDRIQHGYSLGLTGSSEIQSPRKKKSRFMRQENVFDMDPAEWEVTEELRDRGISGQSSTTEREDEMELEVPAHR